MSDVTTPMDFAEELLAAAVAALNTTAAGAPARQAVVPPMPVIDCEQVVVYVPGFVIESTTPGGLAAAHKTQMGLRMNMQTLAVQVVRCVPVPDARGNPPSAAALQTSASAILQDGWAMWNHFSVLIRTGGLFNGKCAALYVDSGVPVPAQGGFGGWTMTVRAQIDGYIPA